MSAVPRQHNIDCCIQGGTTLPSTSSWMLDDLYRASAAGGVHKCICDLDSYLLPLPFNPTGLSTGAQHMVPRWCTLVSNLLGLGCCTQDVLVILTCHMVLCTQVTHAIRYPAPVLSLGLSPDCATLAVGMSSGLLSVKRHAKPPPAAIALAGVNHRIPSDFGR